MSRLSSPLGRVGLAPVASPTSTFVAPAVRREPQAGDDALALGTALTGLAGGLGAVLENRFLDETRSAQTRARTDALRFKSMTDLKSAVDSGQLKEANNPWYMVQLEQEVSRGEARSLARNLRAAYDSSEDAEVVALRNSDDPEAVRKWAMTHFGGLMEGRTSHEIEAMTPEIGQFVEHLQDAHVELRSKQRGVERIEAVKNDVGGLLMAIPEDVVDGLDDEDPAVRAAAGDSLAQHMDGVRALIDEKSLTLEEDKLIELAAESAARSADALESPELLTRAFEELRVNGKPLMDNSDARALYTQAHRRITRLRDERISQARQDDDYNRRKMIDQIQDMFPAGYIPTVEEVVAKAPQGTPASVINEAIAVMTSRVSAAEAGIDRKKLKVHTDAFNIVMQLEMLAPGTGEDYIAAEAPSMLDNYYQINAARAAFHRVRESDPEVRQSLLNAAATSTLTHEDLKTAIEERKITPEDAHHLQSVLAEQKAAGGPPAYSKTEVDVAGRNLVGSIRWQFMSDMAAAQYVPGDEEWKSREADMLARSEAASAVFTQRLLEAMPTVRQLPIRERAAALQSIADEVSSAYGGVRTIDEYLNQTKARADRVEQTAVQNANRAAAEAKQTVQQPAATKETVEPVRQLSDATVVSTLGDPLWEAVASGDRQFAVSNASWNYRYRPPSVVLGTEGAFYAPTSSWMSALSTRGQPAALHATTMRLRTNWLRRAKEIMEIELPKRYDDLLPVMGRSGSDVNTEGGRRVAALLKEYAAIRNYWGYTTEEVRGLSSQEAASKVRLFADLDDLTNRYERVSDELGLTAEQTEAFVQTQSRLLGSTFDTR